MKLPKEREREHTTFRYSLRGVLNAVALLAIALAVWKTVIAPIFERARKQQEVISELRRYGILYHYDDFDFYGWARFRTNAMFEQGVEVLRRSTDPVKVVVLDGLNLTDRMLRSLNKLPELNEVSLENAILQGDRFALKNVSTLIISGSNVAPNTLRCFPNLAALTIDASQLDMQMVAAINASPTIVQLTVESATAGEDAINALMKLGHVKWLRLLGKVPLEDAQVGRLRSQFDVRLK